MVFEFERIRSILVCPKTRKELVLDGNFLISTSPETRLRFPVVDDIPRLLLDEAEELSPEAWGAIMSQAGRDPSTGLVVH